MALNFAKKAASAQPVQTQTFNQKSENKPTASFLMKGATAKQALAEAEAQAEAAAQEKGKMWAFYMKPDETRSITFLDGDLDADGMLDINMVKEHQVKLNGSWHSFICTADIDETQPCPLCTAGEDAKLIGLMTVIDHSKHVIQKGNNAGQTITNQRKLFKAKRGTIGDLTKLAVKRGGLTGCTFDAMRGDDKSPSVGKQFDFTVKHPSLEAVAQAYGLKIEDVQPADYSQELVYRSPEELLELGVGKALTGPGLGGGNFDKNKLKSQL